LQKDDSADGAAQRHVNEQKSFHGPRERGPGGKKKVKKSSRNFW